MTIFGNKIKAGHNREKGWQTRPKLPIHCIISFTLLLMPLVGLSQLPTNNNPNNQIRFTNKKEAEERRNQLIRFIWNDGLPTNALPELTTNVTAEVLGLPFKQLNKELVKRIDRLEIEVLGLTSTVYSLIPEKGQETPRLIVLQAGHGPLEENYLKKKYCTIIDFFLSHGYHVMILNMPMIGWNDDDTVVMPNGKRVTIDPEWPKLHNDIIELGNLKAPSEKGIGFRPFLEPVVTCINYWGQISDVNTDVTMIGLSGGGWTTHLLAAIDTRIKLSFPVAGAYPLYLRNGQENKSHLGDLEQYYEPMYDENIAADGTGGGIATWLEIFTLGGTGKHRKQIMITSQYDDCCFYGDPEKTVDTFKSVVNDKIKELGVGAWEHKLDTTHRKHVISPWALNKVVKPNLPLENY